MSFLVSFCVLALIAAFPVQFLSLPFPFSFPPTCCSKLQLQPLKCSYFWPRGRKVLAPLPGFSIPTWEQGMKESFKGAGWFWGRLQSAQSWVGANLFPWTDLNQTQPAKWILKMCHGLLRYLGFKKKSLKCEMLVDSHSSHLKVWGRCRPANMKQTLNRSCRICSPALLRAAPSHIPACGAVAVGRHCSSGAGGAPGAETLTKMLNVSCFDFRLCSTSGSVQSWFCRWAPQLLL